MSRASNTLKTSDVTVTPFKVVNSYTIPINQENYSKYGLSYQQLSPADITPGVLPSTSQLYYRSIRHLYYSRYLPSVSQNIPISQQNYQQLSDTQNNTSKTTNTLIYDNYLQSTAASGSVEVDDRSQFIYYFAYANQSSSILSIPPRVYGENIKPKSFTLTDGYSIFKDDGNGNVLDYTNPNNPVLLGANILYSQGIVVAIGDDNKSIIDPQYSSYTASFQSEYTIYQNQVNCHISENDFNYTQNPSAIKIGATGSLSDNVTGSEFRPYATCIGLYNERNELLVVGKLSTPYPIPPNTDMTFVVRYDS